MPELEYGPIVEAELGAVARNIHHAFGGPVEGCEKWLRDTGLNNVRVLRVGGTPLANLVRIPMGQFFGGRSVSLLGIAGVAVAPEARGRGLARKMMELGMVEGQRDGFALSGLYASTQTLYRKVGFEQAGHRFMIRLPISRLDGGERSADLRPLAAADEPAVRACYQRFASTFDGPLDRGEYVWQRVHRLRDESYTGFGIDAPDGSGLAGYVFLAQTRKPDSGRFDVTVSDIAFANAPAARRLIGFLADFGTMGEDLVLYGGPLHPILSLIGSVQYKVERKDYWMLRVLDVAGAMHGRGWASGSGEAVVEVEDELIPDNRGAWRMKKDGGRAVAEKCAPANAAACDVRGLAPLYSGLYTARQAELLGWLSGTDHAITAAASVFGGGACPWMSDGF